MDKTGDAYAVEIAEELTQVNPAPAARISRASPGWARSQALMPWAEAWLGGMIPSSSIKRPMAVKGRPFEAAKPTRTIEPSSSLTRPEPCT